MKKIIFNLILVTVLILPLFGHAQTGSVDVIFEHDPLFAEVNFLPGDSVQRYVRIINNQPYAIDAAVQSRNVLDTQGLGSLIKFQVKRSTNILFDGTLAEFLALSGQPGSFELGTLGTGDNVQYDFIADLPVSVGNAYMYKTLGFDLSIVVNENGTVKVYGAGGSITGMTGDQSSGSILGESTGQAGSIGNEQPLILDPRVAGAVTELPRTGVTVGFGIVGLVLAGLFLPWLRKRKSV